MLKKKVPDYLRLPIFDKNSQSNNYILGLFIKTEIRNYFIKYMKKNNIECKSFYNNLISSNKVLEPIIKTDLTNAKKCSKTLVCIPSNNTITKIVFNQILKKCLNFSIK
jgi:dTDP-4-amino-4,6-dideoxygalactose transaminase